MNYVDFIFEMATRAPDSIGQQTFYHGTSSTQAARAILKKGLQPPNLEGRKSMLTPVNGMVYLTPNLGYALIYAAGGNFVGNASYRIPYRGANKEKFKYILSGRDGTEQRFGYVFEVPGSAFTAVQPDEDEIGELYHHVLNGGPSEHYSVRELTIWRKFMESPLRHSFGYLLDSCATPKQKAEIKWGSISHYAHVGKKAVKRMSDDMKAWLCEIGLHVAHQGAVMPTRCWKFDKTKIGYLDKDGANLPEIATLIDIPTK